MIITLSPDLNYKPKDPVTLLPGEIEDYDFIDIASQIFDILSGLKFCNLISKVPYDSVDEVLETVVRMLDDIDFDDEEEQITEYRHIRMEYRDEMLAIEVYIGV